MSVASHVRQRPLWISAAPPGAVSWRLAQRFYLDRRRQTLAFALLYAVVAYIQPVSYRHTYPTLADRHGFALSFGGDRAIRLFYGVPHNLLTVGGYTAWRVGGTLALVSAAWAAVTMVGLLRGEEDLGRAELISALPVSRLSRFAAALLALVMQATTIAALFGLGLVAAGLPVTGSLVLVAAVMAMVPVFAGLGAVAGQLAGTRRRAVELAMLMLAVAFALRVSGDTVTGAGWLRWISPLGWAEQARAFAGPDGLVLLLPLAFGGVLLGAAEVVSERRDVGAGLLAGSDSHAGDRALLGSPLAIAVRSELVTGLTWLVSVGVLALLFGVIAKSVSSAGVPPALRRELARAGAGSVATPSGYLGLVFLVFVLAASLFSASQIGALRTEELTGRLATMLALPLARARWLISRLVVIDAAAAAISLVAGVAAWAGAHAAGASVSLSGLLEAAINCWAVASLFLGLGAVAYACAPRSAPAVVYGLVTVTFLWQLFGSVLGAPSWALDISPFAHLGLAPARAFRPDAAATLAALGFAAAGSACGLLSRRDVTSGT